jgi:hypothetical protein
MLQAAHRFGITRALAVCMATLLLGTSVLASPRLISPLPGSQHAQNANVLYSWNSVPGALYYIVRFASSIGGQFDTCSFDAPRIVFGTSVSYPHEQVHDPLVVWVQAVCGPPENYGNPSLGYHFVGSPTSAVAVPVISGPWGSLETRNVAILHSWGAVAGAVFYEVQFANAPPNTADLFLNCDWDPIRIVMGTAFSTSHQSVHCPLYWRVRAVDGAGNRGNWAVSYYYVDSQFCDPCKSTAIGNSTWSAVKQLFE